MNHVELANQFHNNGFGCAQAVLAAFANDYGMDTTTALKIATGFGSGMGRLCEVCGALTGAFMVIGLKHGKVNSDGSKYGPATETSYALVSELAKRFQSRFGSIKCGELIHLDLSKPEDRAYALNNNVFKIQCGSHIEETVILLENLMAEHDAAAQ